MMIAVGVAKSNLNCDTLPQNIEVYYEKAVRATKTCNNPNTNASKNGLLAQDVIDRKGKVANFNMNECWTLILEFINTHAPHGLTSARGINTLRSDRQQSNSTHLDTPSLAPYIKREANENYDLHSNQEHQPPLRSKLLVGQPTPVSHKYLESRKINDILTRKYKTRSLVPILQAPYLFLQTMILGPRRGF